MKYTPWSEDDYSAPSFLPICLLSLRRGDQEAPGSGSEGRSTGRSYPGGATQVELRTSPKASQAPSDHLPLSHPQTKNKLANHTTTT